MFYKMSDGSLKCEYELGETTVFMDAFGYGRMGDDCHLTVSKDLPEPSERRISIHGVDTYWQKMKRSIY